MTLVDGGLQVSVLLYQTIDQAMGQFKETFDGRSYSYLFRLL
jgi:hypothetical protein